MKMFSGVPVNGTVAAANVTATLAQPQMHPTVARFQTIFASIGAWFYRNDSRYMFTIIHLEIASLSVFDNLTPLVAPTQIIETRPLTSAVINNKFE